MSNIYEALQLAQQEQKVRDTAGFAFPRESSQILREVREEPLLPSLAAERCGCATIELGALYQNIDYCFPDIPSRAIQFIASREGEGVSTIVRDFAVHAATVLGKEVLIVDAADRNPCQHINFNIPTACSWKDFLGKPESAEKGIVPTSRPHLYLSPLPPRPALPDGRYDPVAAGELLAEFRKRFDLVLIDSSPATVSPESVALSRVADGVVLVFEAEKTRWKVAEKVRDRIIAGGGNLLGIVFSKRRFHIPEAVYGMLR